MKFTRLVTGSVAAIAVLSAAAALAPGPLAWAAQPSTLWVGTNPAVPGGTSCARPGYNAIQAAINAAPAGGQIVVCAGTYTEQLQITKSLLISGRGTVVVQLPASPANATTTCDAQMASGNPPGEQDQDGISICGDVTVALTGLTVDAAWPASTCYDALYGVMVAGGATLLFDNSQITAAGAVPLNGCQGGIGIEVGDSVSTPPQVGHLVLRDSTIKGYQKNGMTIDGTGSTADILAATVSGIGATTQIAQNGIQVSDGASAHIDRSSISGNECDYPSVCGPNGLTQTQSAGVLIYATDAPVTVTGSDLSGNDIGLYYDADPSKAAPARPTAVIDGDQFNGNRYEGVQLDQGSALVEDCFLTGGNVGVQAIQYAQQTFGINSIVSDVVIKDMSVSTVQVLSDQTAGDHPGTLLVADSLIRTAPVLNNSSNIRLIQVGDH